MVGDETSGEAAEFKLRQQEYELAIKEYKRFKKLEDLVFGSYVIIPFTLFYFKTEIHLPGIHWFGPYYPFTQFTGIDVMYFQYFVFALGSFYIWGYFHLKQNCSWFYVYINQPAFAEMNFERVQRRIRTLRWMALIGPFGFIVCSWPIEVWSNGPRHSPGMQLFIGHMSAWLTFLIWRFFFLSRSLKKEHKLKLADEF